MDISRIVYDYFFANKEELKYSPFKLGKSADHYDSRIDGYNFIKAGMPLLAEAGLFVYFLLSPNLNLTTKIIGEALILSDVISRQIGVSETDTYYYSIIGRTRDMYKNLIKK